ncbi:porin [Chryseosolibacter indicus]|uniref:Porin n=1 Tax=Chryseosolibacter indicus TaxID=2782351 RepID=A0ABS5VWB4_9BACT|nr:porin [Chryseosolibacter indicus]MBT1705112.1 porin [Chryseosolibacter indicus]
MPCPNKSLSQVSKTLLALTFLGLIFHFNGFSQTQSTIPYFTYGKGLGITSPDSLFQLNIRFRMQNRLGLRTKSESNLDISEVEARIRRLRLRFDGFVYTKKLNYVIQLAFTRSDMDYDDTGFPNVVRDAMVLYNFNKHFTIGLGQTKLPGNRQRVNSSGDLQLPDRSIVNSTFNIDRDFGLQLYYNNSISSLYYVLRGAISSGEGRNFNSSDRGLAYTGRIEFLPLGTFTNNGDYFEGDLARESKPKVSLGLSYSNNQNAIRTGGQLGKFLFAPRDIQTYMADFLFKYNGWAFASEFIKRNANDPITVNDAGEQRHVYVGHGENYQGSYLFKNNFEVIGRYSRVKPDEDLIEIEEIVEQYTLGFTKYLRGHRVKLQSELTYENNNWLNDTEDTGSYIVRFQIEFGI